MPRKAREKHEEAIYHIICRSVSEVLLFKNDKDKEYFLGKLKKYLEKYKCKLYAYCLMDTHLHLHFDPCGFDISQFMRCLNTAYVRYYNTKYTRRGPLFQDRFESRILDNDEYNLAVSAYIHCNPHDIASYKGREEAYPYSSYGIYLGLRKDVHGLVDKSFIKHLFNNPVDFSRKYLEFVSHQKDTKSLETLKKKLSQALEKEYIPGHRTIIRDKSPAKIISYISCRLLMPENGLKLKGKRQLIRFRSFTAYVLRVLCGMGYKEMSNSLCNITISGCSKLCDKGYQLTAEDPELQSIFSHLAVSRL